MKQKQVRSLALVLLFLGVAMLLGVAAFILGSNLGRQNELNVIRVDGQTAGEQVFPLPEIPRVGTGDAKAAVDIGNAVIIDVRDAESYASGHIPGSVNIPEDEILARISELDPRNWIITVCT